MTVALLTSTMQGYQAEVSDKRVIRAEQKRDRSGPESDLNATLTDKVKIDRYLVSSPAEWFVADSRSLRCFTTAPADHCSIMPCSGYTLPRQFPHWRGFLPRTTCLLTVPTKTALGLRLIAYCHLRLPEAQPTVTAPSTPHDFSASS